MIRLTPTQEKLFNYLVTHKKPVPIKKLSHHFLISPKTVEAALRALHLMGLADRSRVNGRFFYEIKQ